MEQLQGKDLSKVIKSALVKKGVSKDGNDYYYISLEFINGYEHRVFLRSDNVFALMDALRRGDESKTSSKSDFWD